MTRPFTQAPATAPPSRARRGGTLVQLLVVLGIIALLVALVLPTVGRLRAASKSTACLANLRNIGTAFRLYASNNGDQLPYPAFTQIPWERSLLKYVSADAFICPADEELGPATNSSYDWRDTGIEESTLAGKSIFAGRSSALLAFDALPGWHNDGRMNTVWTDGSAGSFTADEVAADLKQAFRPP